MNFKKKLKQIFETNSMITEHLKALVYCLLFLVPVFISSFCIRIMRKASKDSLLLAISLITVILICIYSFLLIKSLVKNFMSQHFMIGFILLLGLVTSVILIFIWGGITVGMLLKLYTSNNLGNKFFKSFSQLLGIFYKNFEIVGTPILQITTSLVSVSLLSTGILPDKLSKLDIPIKLRLLRILIKLFLCVGILLVSLLFLCIDRRNFIILTVMISLLIFLCNPKSILRILSDRTYIKKERISEGVEKVFAILKLFIFLIYIAWATSVYTTNNIINREEIFILIMVGCPLLVLIIKIVLNSLKKDPFEKWFVGKKGTKKAKRYRQ